MDLSEYRKVGSRPHFWKYLVLGQITIFLASISILLLLIKLQSEQKVGALGTWLLLLLSVAGFESLFHWDMAPIIKCEKCSTLRKKRYLENQKLKGKRPSHMVMVCEKCKTYIDLGVSID